jgi:hypothetical protein
MHGILTFKFYLIIIISLTSQLLQNKTNFFTRDIRDSQGGVRRRVVR